LSLSVQRVVFGGMVGVVLTHIDVGTTLDVPSQ